MRKIAGLFLGILLFLVGFSITYAANDFNTYTTIVYDVNNSGKTTVIHNITLENAVTDLYATSYGISLNTTQISDVRAYQKQKSLNPQITQKDGKTSISISFDDAVVGKGEKREFSISYTDPTIFTKNGAVWEALIPQLSDDSDFYDYNVVLQVPSSLGGLSYITPTPLSKNVQNNKNVYRFGKNQLSQSAITAAFGEFQVFSFDLTYHLENPLSQNAFTEIALPPDTNYQKVFLDSLEPKPDQVSIDGDGNWLAKYVMSSRQRFDVMAKGSVQIYASPHSESYADSQTLKDSLAPTEVWQTQDPKIIELANKLKTPKAIYDYVVSTLSYNYDKVKPNVVRMGASEVLNNPDQAICMEFTDLFIAIARAAGIPAREINGYAYTENSKLQPLSLVADVLHSWPEYWDEARGEWIQIDPTWGSTSGIDFFNRMDLRHFAFVIHGKDANEPYPAGSYKLGPNPQKDVYISFSQKFNTLQSDLNIEAKNYSVVLSNNGPNLATGVNVDVYFDDQKKQTFTAQKLPPFGHFNFSIQAPYGFLGKNMPEEVILISGDHKIIIPTNRQSVIITQVVIILGVFITIIGLILIFTKRHKIIKYLKKIKIDVKLPNIKHIFKRSS